MIRLVCILIALFPLLACDIASGRDEQSAFSLAAPPDPQIACDEFIGIVCTGLDPYLDNCDAELDAGWEWIDSNGYTRRVGGCAQRTIALVYPCYAAVDRLVAPGDDETDYERALYACSSFDGFSEPVQ